MQNTSVETVTVDVAIKTGQRQLIYQPMAIMGIAFVIFFCALPFLKDGTIWVPVFGFSGVLSALMLPLLVYLIMLPRWRIWAFSNVRNVHELKERAELIRIYPKENSFLWRLEITSAAQREVIADLERKFEQPDIFMDDPTIPFETAYAYSSVQNLFYLLFTIFSVAASVIFFVMDELLLAFLLLAMSIPFAVMTVKRYKAKGPLLVISNDGITTKDHGFNPWADIENERVFYVSAGKASYYGFAYEVHGNTLQMSLKELTGLSSYKIDPILRTYRGRYEATKKK